MIRRLYRTQLHISTKRKCMGRKILKIISTTWKVDCNPNDGIQLWIESNVIKSNKKKKKKNPADSMKSNDLHSKSLYIVRTTDSSKFCVPSGTQEYIKFYLNDYIAFAVISVKYDVLIKLINTEQSVLPTFPSDYPIRDNYSIRPESSCVCS